MSEHAATAGPLLEWFASRGLLRSVDGVGHPDLVAARISEALALRPLANA